MGTDEMKEIEAYATGKKHIVQPNDETYEGVVVFFTQSQRRAIWTFYEGTLLDFADRCAIKAPRACEQADCGKCRAQIKNGDTKLIKQPECSLDDQEVLLCCTLPVGPTPVEIAY